MKKMLALILALGMTFGAASCANKGGNSEESSKESSSGNFEEEILGIEFEEREMKTDGQLYTGGNVTYDAVLWQKPEVEYDSTLASFTSSDESVITAVKSGKGALLTAVSDGEAQVTVKYGAFEKTISFYVINDKIFEFDFDGKNSGELNLWAALSNDVSFNYNNSSDARNTMSVSAGKSVTLPKITDTSVSKYNYLVITAKAQSDANVSVAFTTDTNTGSVSTTVKSKSDFRDCVLTFPPCLLGRAINRMS
jgi:hypothetical protein